MFTLNKVYKRSTLHDKYGGNRQGGIANCANHPMILLFTGKAGEQHGYEDGWDDNNFFHYTGEGQTGDMQFIRGNKKLLDHEKNGKSVFLFEAHNTGLWRFIDELQLVDYDYFVGNDREGNQRRAIKFKFTASTEKTKNLKGKFRKSTNYNKPNTTERKGLVTSRVGQGWFRNQLLERWDYKCAVTGLDNTEILIASHIVPWKDASDEERLDPDNGILLSPNLDALFDKYLIAFNDNGEIIVSNVLTITQKQLLDINTNVRLRKVSPKMQKYLRKHKSQLVAN